MSAPVYIDELLRAVASDVRATLAGQLGPQTPEALVDEVYALGDTLVRAFDEKTPADRRRLPVCQPGCDSCCHLHMVFVSPLEALRLATHLRETLASEELAALTARMREFAERIAEMTVDDRAAARVPCPLLDKHGACSVHSARPLLCRGYNSCDLGGCLAAFEAGTAKTRLPCNAEQVSVHQTLFAALILGGADRRDPGPLELVHAVLAALEYDDATSRWLRGDEVFSREEARVSRDASCEWDVFIVRRR
jgi:Fe-S-cluster containining protein